MVGFAKLIPSNKFILLCQTYLATVSPGLGTGCWLLTAHSPPAPHRQVPSTQAHCSGRHERHPATWNWGHLLSDCDNKWLPANENTQLHSELDLLLRRTKVLDTTCPRRVQ